MLNPESLADLTARRDAIRDEIRDRNEELKHIDALLALWRARKKGKRRAARPAHGAGVEALSNGSWADRQGETKQDRIVREVRKLLEKLPDHTAHFPDVFRMLSQELVGSGRGAREYTRTSLLRLGANYGVVYGQGGRLWLATPGRTGVVEPPTTNPFEIVAQGETPYTIVLRDTHD